MIVFIDGENFRQNLAQILVDGGAIAGKDEFFKYDIAGLLMDIMGREDLDIRYYASEIKTPKGYEPSKNIQKQLGKIKENMRRWVAVIKNQGITYIKAGNLKIKEKKACWKCGAQNEVLQEKGVDVRLALDMLELSMGGNGNEFAVVSSDTDLCPAYHKIKAHGVEVKYICFASRINRAVSAVCGETITITVAKAKEYLL